MCNLLAIWPFNWWNRSLFTLRYTRLHKMQSCAVCRYIEVIHTNVTGVLTSNCWRCVD